MIHIHFKPSPQLACFCIALHVGAIGCILFSQAPIWVVILGVMFCGASFVWIWLRVIGLSGKAAVVQLMIGDDKRWQVLQKDGQLREVVLQGESFVTSFLLILNVKAGKGYGHRSVLICRDSVVEPDNFRRLCVHLKTNA